MQLLPMSQLQNRIYPEVILNLLLHIHFVKNLTPLIDVYDENGKVEIVRNTDIFIPKVVGAEAGYLINDTNA